MGYDVGWGMGSVHYDDSITTILERMTRSYIPQGLQVVAKELLGPVALQQQLDFTWDTYVDRNKKSTGSIARFSRSVSVLGGAGILLRRTIQFEPAVGYGWTFVKLKAKPGVNSSFMEDEDTKLYSGLVASGEFLANTSSNSGLRFLYAHGFFDEAVDRITVQFGGLWRPDRDYEHVFAAIGLRTAWYAGHIRELIFMLNIGGASK